jgi:hypothetical protein
MLCINSGVLGHRYTSDRTYFETFFSLPKRRFYIQSQPNQYGHGIAIPCFLFSSVLLEGSV